MRRTRFAVIVLLVCTILSASAAFAAPAVVSIATGGTSGTYYPIGVAIAGAVSKGSDIRATAETGNAAVANINLIEQGEIEIAMVQNDVTAWALNGEVMFEGNPLKKVRAICALYPETIQLVLSNTAGVKTLDDLKGKNIGIGAPGSGTEGDARAIFNSVGLKYEDMKIESLDFAVTSSRFKDNQIDAGFVVAGIPTAALMDLTTTRNVSLFNFDGATADKIIKANPYFVKNVIPAGTYRGIDADTNTLAVMAILVANEDVPEDVIYNFTKGMFTNIADIQGSHAMARNITLENALSGLTAPLHPGAAKYFKEAGLKVD
jgi:TRAP transporter TAXI family solute receptor